MNKKFNIIIIALAALLSVAFMAPRFCFAQSEEPKPEKTDKKGGLKAFLKLTDDQQQKLKEVHQQYNNALEDIHISSMRRKLELAEEMKKDEPDRKKIDELLITINQLDLKKQKTIMDEFFAIRKILSPEQRTFFTRKFIRQMTGGMKGQQ
ncbi:MAG: periplasmic heavy metal sensor [Firmicutes bacterium]|nr:periplasmic heavy metal sensor [Bacillota bacterium]